MKSFIFAITLALIASFGVYALNQGETKNVITCVICTDLMEIVNDAILSNSTIAQIEELLGNFCDLLVGMEQDCKNFVHEQLPNIIGLLVNEYLTPDEVCISLSLCP